MADSTQRYIVVNGYNDSKTGHVSISIQGIEFEQQFRVDTVLANPVNWVSPANLVADVLGTGITGTLDGTTGLAQDTDRFNAITIRIPVTRAQENKALELVTNALPINSYGLLGGNCVDYVDYVLEGIGAERDWREEWARLGGMSGWNPIELYIEFTASRTPTPDVSNFPVGTVSSARLPGQLGMIDGGNEANALDLISHETATAAYPYGQGRYGWVNGIYVDKAPREVSSARHSFGDGDNSIDNDWRRPDDGGAHSNSRGVTHGTGASPTFSAVKSTPTSDNGPKPGGYTVKTSAVSPTTGEAVYDRGVYAAEGPEAAGAGVEASNSKTTQQTHKRKNV